MARLVLPVSEDSDHILGPADAPITLLEYGDFECPSCGQAYPEVAEVLRQSGDHVRFVFRHFPLTRIHPHAQRAAEAAEAAAAQGRFWDMHGLLFENQQALDANDLVTYARRLDLDLVRFRDDLVSGDHLRHVREDFLSGVRSGVNGTPSFFINEQRYDGPWDVASLLAALAHATPRRRSAPHVSRTR